MILLWYYKGGKPQWTQTKQLIDPVLPSGKPKIRS